MTAPVPGGLPGQSFAPAPRPMPAPLRLGPRVH